MNAKDAILYLYDKGLLNIDAIMKNKDSIMQELDNATENKPKCDLTRLFKKGDKVRVVEWNGRCDGRDGEYLRGAFCEVLNDEEKNYNVHLNHNGSLYHIDAAYLELVTPVEEVMPYRVKDDGGFYYIEKEDETYALCTFNKRSHPNAKAAADAECARLNAEWRKEQNND